MIRVGIVVQRYGGEVVGGAETLARDVAERLNRDGHDVTVFTTTALDYISWANHFPAGESILKGVRIRRFPVERERDIADFNNFSETFFREKRSVDEENEWLQRQGPYCPELVQALRKNDQDVDIFIFFTYLYYTTVEGLRAVSKPSILFPTAHDELPIYMGVMREMFSRPRAFMFLTQAELNFVRKTFQPSQPLLLARTGLDPATAPDEKDFRLRYFIFAPYILYAGRIERGKGLDAVFSAYEDIQKQRLIDLVLIGKKLMDIPRFERIKYLGFIPEEDKMAAFKGAVASIQPSPVESLSITTLESFSQKTPVLVNGQCAVLCEHVELSGGGLIFNHPGELAEQVIRIHDNRKLRRVMGEKGLAYVRSEFDWDIVMSRIRSGIKSLVDS